MRSGTIFSTDRMSGVSTEFHADVGRRSSTALSPSKRVTSTSASDQRFAPRSVAFPARLMEARRKSLSNS